MRVLSLASFHTVCGIFRQVPWGVKEAGERVRGVRDIAQGMLHRSSPLMNTCKRGRNVQDEGWETVQSLMFPDPWPCPPAGAPSLANDFCDWLSLGAWQTEGGFCDCERL